MVNSEDSSRALEGAHERTSAGDGPSESGPSQGGSQKGSRGRRSSGLATPRLIAFTTEVDDYLKEGHRATGTPVTEQVRRAVAREKDGTVPVISDLPRAALPGSLDVARAAVKRRLNAGTVVALQPGDCFFEAPDDSAAPTIFKGDLVLLRPGAEHQQGELYAVQIWKGEEREGECDEITIGKLFRDPATGTVTIKCNDTDTPRRISETCMTVIGMCCCLIRHLDKPKSR